MEKIKVLLDTDIGDDIDDALSLSLALKMQDKMEIIGVTTTYMDTVYRAKMVKRFFTEFNLKAPPIYAGASKTADGFNSHDLTLSKTYGQDFIEDFSVNQNEEDAVDFIIDCCYKYKKELTIIAIGPFTNIANAIKKDKKAFDLINGIVIMGGAFYKQYADWNVFCDPISAKILFDDAKNLLAVGADVTHKLPVPNNYLDKILNYTGNDNGIKFLSKHANAWRKAGEEKWGNKPNLVLHDPLAVYSAVDKSFIVTEDITVKVETENALKGFTFNINAYSKSHLNDYYKDKEFNKVSACKEVDAIGFIDKYFSIILNN